MSPLDWQGPEFLSRYVPLLPSLVNGTVLLLCLAKLFVVGLSRGRLVLVLALIAAQA